MKEAANIYQPHSRWNPKSNNNLLQPLLYIIYPTSLNQNETGTRKQETGMKQDAISKWNAISYRTIYLEHMVRTIDFVYCVYTKHISGSKYSYFDHPVVFETSRTTCSSPSKTNGHSSPVLMTSLIATPLWGHVSVVDGRVGPGSATTLLSLSQSVMALIVLYCCGHIISSTLRLWHRVDGKAVFADKPSCQEKYQFNTGATTGFRHISL